MGTSPSGASRLPFGGVPFAFALASPLLAGALEDACPQQLPLSAKLVFHTHFLLHLHQNQDANLSKVHLDLGRSLQVGACKPQHPQGSDSRREVLKFTKKTGRD